MCSALELTRTAGQLLYAEQVIELLGLLGLDWARADAVRAALVRGRMGERIDHERYICQEAKKHRWTAEQTDGLSALLLEHAGNQHAHGHSLAMAQHAFCQACLKVNPATTAAFFAEVLNYGMVSSSCMACADSPA